MDHLPTYNFRCEKCGEQYEVFTSFSKIDTVTCPACGGTEKERIYKTAVQGPVAGCGPVGSGFA